MTPANIRKLAGSPMNYSAHLALMKLADLVEIATMVSDPKQWIQNDSTRRIQLELRIPLEQIEKL